MTNIIETLTKDCPQEDCEIVCLGSSTTLLGWLQTYDRKGNPKNQDPNTTKTGYACRKCGVSWYVKTRRGESAVERFEPLVTPQAKSVFSS